MKFKDHELEDGTKALVPLSVGRHVSAQHSVAGSSICWVKDLCQGAVRVRRRMTPKKRQTQKKPHDQKQKRESSAIRKGSQLLSTTSETSFSTRPASVSSVTPRKFFGQRCVSTNAAAGKHLGGDGAGGGFCDLERW